MGYVKRSSQLIYATGKQATLHIIFGFETQLVITLFPSLEVDIRHAAETIHVAPDLCGIAGRQVVLVTKESVLCNPMNVWGIIT